MALKMILSCLAFLAITRGTTGAVTSAPLPAGVANPCTPTAIANEDFYFAYPGDSTRFIQCDEGGNAFVLSCPAGQEWSSSSVACFTPDPAPNAVCQSTGQLVADPCNHHDYFMCNVALVPLRFNCPSGLYFNTAGYCDYVDTNNDTC